MATGTSAGSSNKQNQNLDKLQSDVDEVAELLKDNIDKVLDRGDKLDDMMDRTEDLSAGAEQFQKTSKKVKRKYCMNNAKMTCILIIVGICIVLVIVLVVVLVTKPWQGGDSGGGNGTITFGHD
ncbi:vesicle-associated membrane protein 3-like [Ptychodera flava]|uniref:vesicle-associated membrane protein 3-like n=1 Tax=Ptychodera flava TaxID=63121 RepID=UPI003969E013